MSLSEEERSSLVSLYWEKAELTLKEMEVSVNAQLWSMAANRMYYALFHAITALLVKDGHPVHSHLGVKIALGKYYVQTGVLTSDQGRLFSRLATLREKADYDCVFNATEDDIMIYIPAAKEMFNSVKQLVL